MFSLDTPSEASLPLDPTLLALARHALVGETGGESALIAARAGLMGALCRAFRALQSPRCVRRLGPTVPGATFPGGPRVPGTSFELEPVQAAFNIGLLMGFAESCLSGACLGATLAVADYTARLAVLEGRQPLLMRDVLQALIKAQDIERALSSASVPQSGGHDPVPFVRIASTAAAAALLGASEAQIVNALSNAVLDGAGPPHCGNEWVAADVSSRAVRHALMALAGETGCSAAPALQLHGLNDITPGGHVDIGEDETLMRDVYARLVEATYPVKQQPLVQGLFADPAALDAMPVQAFMAALVRNG